MGWKAVLILLSLALAGHALALLLRGGTAEAQYDGQRGRFPSKVHLHCNGVGLPSPTPGLASLVDMNCEGDLR